MGRCGSWRSAPAGTIPDANRSHRDETAVSTKRLAYRLLTVVGFVKVRSSGPMNSILCTNARRTSHLHKYSYTVHVGILVDMLWFGPVNVQYGARLHAQAPSNMDPQRVSALARAPLKNRSTQICCQYSNDSRSVSSESNPLLAKSLLPVRSLPHARVANTMKKSIKIRSSSALCRSRLCFWHPIADGSPLASSYPATTASQGLAVETPKAKQDFLVKPRLP